MKTETTPSPLSSLAAMRLRERQAAVYRRERRRVDMRHYAVVVAVLAALAVPVLSMAANSTAVSTDAQTTRAQALTTFEHAML